MAWLQAHANLISALASAGMMLIWVVYAWLFYQEFRRQRGSELFIHEAGGGEPEAACMLVNLSSEPVHVLCSLASRDGTTIRLRDMSGDESLSIPGRTKQGPLGCGESLTLGAFEDICRELDRSAEPAHRDESQLVEIRVAAIHALREWPVGARRRFRIDAGTTGVRPESTRTQQLRSRRQAREVQRWIQASQDPRKKRISG